VGPRLGSTHGARSEPQRAHGWRDGPGGTHIAGGGAARDAPPAASGFRQGHETVCVRLPQQQRCRCAGNREPAEMAGGQRSEPGNPRSRPWTEPLGTGLHARRAMVTSVPDTGLDGRDGGVQLHGERDRSAPSRERASDADAHRSPRQTEPIAGRVEVAPPHAFDDLDALTHSLEGASTIHNTYWVRLSPRDFSLAAAFTLGFSMKSM
jgi:hypothetical protein